MIRLDARRTQRMLLVHGWFAVALGLLTYIVLVTGSVAILGREIATWSSAWTGEPRTTLGKGTDATLRTIAASTGSSHHESVEVYARASGRLWAFFSGDGTQPDQGVGVHFDADGTILARHEGTKVALRYGDEINALATFFKYLHIRLHAPDPWGKAITGTLGLALAAFAISGFLLHRDYLRDLFVIRRRDAKLRARELHTVAGSWLLPFALMSALTGAYMGLYSPVTLPVVAAVGFEGETAPYNASAFPPMLSESAEAATLTNLDAILAETERRAGRAVKYLEIRHWGRADAHVVAGVKQDARTMLEHYYHYAGVDGRLLQAMVGGFGTASSAGGTLENLYGMLHFGEFAEEASRYLWALLGIGTAYVSLTGMRLWTRRRLAQNRNWRHLHAATDWIGYGFPLAMAAVPIGHFAARALGQPLYAWMLGALLATLAFAAAPAWRAPDARRTLLAATGVVLLVLPLLRWTSGGASWAALASAERYVAPVIDGAMLLSGLALLRMPRRIVALTAACSPPDRAVGDGSAGRRT